MTFAVLLPVGPGAREIARAADTLDSLWTYEPEVSVCVLVDDGLPPRPLARLLPAPPRGCQLASITNPRHGKGDGLYGGLCAGVLAGLAWIHEHAPAPFTLKLDTDALVIAPFADKVRSACRAAAPAPLVVGSCDRTCDGGTRDVSVWAEKVRRLATPFGDWRSPFRPGGGLHVSSRAQAATIRSHVRAALARGYRPGEHCLGGAYAVSSGVIAGMAASGYLDDPLLWLAFHMGEDVMVGLYARAVGARLQSLVENDEPFGLAWKGLPDRPDRLLSRGFSLIHSVKSGGESAEEEVRAFFRAARHRHAQRA